MKLKYSWLKVWIIPGAVFQSVTVGGAYGTGRDVVEWISQYGALAGLASVVLIAFMMALVMAVTFEFAVRFQLRDYRVFFKKLLGPFWISYEIVFLVALVLVLAIASSAAGKVLHGSFGWPNSVGVGVMMSVVVLCSYFGRKWVELTLTFWGLLMSALLVVYAALIFIYKGDAIAEVFHSDEFEFGEDWRWAISSAKFFLYSAFVVPVVLYTTEHIKTRRQAWGAGLVAALMGMLPGLVYHITFMAKFPAVLEQELPTYWMLQQLGFPLLIMIYVAVLFGTITQTGVGVLQGINERIDTWWGERHGRPLHRRNHSLIAGGAMIASVLLSNIGIVALVAHGFGFLSWFSLGIFALPILTRGVWLLRRANSEQHSHLLD